LTLEASIKGIYVAVHCFRRAGGVSPLLEEETGGLRPPLAGFVR